MQSQAKTTADELMAGMIPGDAEGTYCWQDLDYADQSRNSWRASYHYNRLEMVLALGGKERFCSDSAFRDKTLGAFRYWLIHDYKNPNWWHNDIGMPCHIGDIALMTWDVLSPEERARAVELTARGSLKTRRDILRWTGANLMWGIYDTLKHAFLTDDVALMQEALARLEQEFAFSSEGIQEDGAFYQHGPRWYSGGYGASFTFDAAQLIYLFRGTAFQFPREKLEIFLHHVLDGQRHMMLHGYFDYNGIGRELARRGSIRNRSVIFALELLAEVEDLPRRDEILAFREDNRHGAAEDSDDPLTFTKYYPSVSYLSHRTGGTYIGVKCHAAGQYDAEICNSEAELCYNMSYGTRVCLMRRGDEYLDLDPIYDWAHVPGTTARLENDAQLLAHRNWWCLPLPNDHTGGLTLGDRGILYQRAEHDGITLTAAYFTFDGCLVALGAGIRDEQENGLPLTTTLDQCRPDRPEFPADGKTASNGGFTYHNLDGQTELVARTERREGSWKRNNFEEDYAPESGEVFLAYIPVRAGYDRYAFGVSPRGKALTVSVISNTEDCQAIRLPDGTVMAVFHRTCELALGEERISGGAGQCLILPAVNF